MAIMLKTVNGIMLERPRKKKLVHTIFMCSEGGKRLIENGEILIDDDRADMLDAYRLATRHRQGQRQIRRRLLDLSEASTEYTYTHRHENYSVFSYYSPTLFTLSCCSLFLKGACLSDCVICRSPQPPLLIPHHVEYGPFP